MKKAVVLGKSHVLFLCGSHIRCAHLPSLTSKLRLRDKSIPFLDLNIPMPRHVIYAGVDIMGSDSFYMLCCEGKVFSLHISTNENDAQPKANFNLKEPKYDFKDDILKPFQKTGFSFSK